MTRRRRPGYLGRFTQAQLDAAAVTDPGDVDEVRQALETVRAFAADVADKIRPNQTEGGTQ